MPVNHQYQKLQDPAFNHDQFVLVADAKKKIVDWYTTVKIDNPSVILPINQLTDGYLYPHSLPVLDENHALKLKHFLKLINRLKLLRLPKELAHQAQDLITSNPDADKLINFFADLQSQCIDRVNQKAEKKIDELAVKLFTNKNTDSHKQFIYNVVAYKALAKHGNKRDDYACLLAYIEELKADNEMLSITQRQLHEIIKLRSEIQKDYDDLNTDLKRVKRDINRYLCDIDSKHLIRHKDKACGLPGRATKKRSSKKKNPTKKEFRLFKKLYIVTKSSAELKKHKNSLYHKKDQAEAVSKVVSSNVAFGEGVVPAVAMFTALSSFGPQVALPVALLCGISGGVFNKFLVQADTFDVLKKLLFKDSLNRMASAAEDYQLFFSSGTDAHDNLKPEQISESTIYIDFSISQKWIRYKGKNHDGSFFSLSIQDAVPTLPINIEKLTDDELRKKLTQGGEHFDPIVHEALCAYVLRVAADQGHTGSLAMKQLKKDAAIALGGLSLTTGLVYGALSAMNLYAKLIVPLLLASKVSLGTATAIGLALSLPPVALTALGFFSLYFFMITDLIHKERWIDIKNYFLKKFVHVGWSELGGLDLIKQIFACLFEILKLAIVVGVASTVSFFSFRLFHEQVVGVASALMSMSNAQFVGYVITSISTTICYLFNIKKVDEITRPIRIQQIVSGILLLPFRLALFALAAANSVVKLSVSGVAMLPYMLMQLTHRLLIVTPLMLMSLTLSLVGVTFKLIEHLFTGKLPVNLLAAGVVTPLVLVAALWAFAWKCLTVACYVPILAISALTFGKINMSPIWQALAAVSQFIELPALAAFSLAKNVANIAEQYSQMIDAAGFNSMATKADTFVSKGQNSLIKARNRVDENSTYQQFRTGLFGVGAGVFSGNNYINPFALAAQALSRGINVANTMFDSDAPAVKQAPAVANTKTVADQVDDFKQAVSDVCFSAVTPNSGGQAVMFAFGQAYWWQRLLVLTCSYTASAVPNVSQMRGTLDEQFSFGPTA